MAVVPPVGRVQEINAAVIDDMRAASRRYCEDFDYTCAFEDLVTTTETAEQLRCVLSGQLDCVAGIKLLYDGLLAPWRSTRSLPPKRIPAIAKGLEQATPLLRQIPSEVSIETATDKHLELVVRAFGILDACEGVGATVASKLIAPFRPALALMWDNYISWEYGFAESEAGYRRFMYLMRDFAKRLRELAGDKLESSLHPASRKWNAPLAKAIDEWHWIRITQEQLKAAAQEGH